MQTNKEDDAIAWRPHAAIILANLCTPQSLNTVYQLGRALAARGCDAAADFCFIAVYLLGGYDVFRPLA